MPDNFSIELISDLDFEGMVVEISFGNQRIAMINYDKDINNIEIEILPINEEVSKCIFPLNDFLIVVEKAKEIAIRCAKEDELRRQK